MPTLPTLVVRRRSPVAAAAVASAAALFLVLGGLGPTGAIACYPTGSIDPGPDPSAAYFLERIEGSPLPVVVAVAGGEPRRIIADTLRFPSHGFYSETTISQAVASTVNERTDRPSAPYMNQASSQLRLPAFVGGAGIASYSATALNVIADDGRLWGYSVVR